MDYSDFQLMERIQEKYTAEELCELLGLTAYEILDAFEHRWVNNKELLETL